MWQFFNSNKSDQSFTKYTTTTTKNNKKKSDETSSLSVIAGICRLVLAVVKYAYFRPFMSSFDLNEHGGFHH